MKRPRLCAFVLLLWVTGGWAADPKTGAAAGGDLLKTRWAAEALRKTPWPEYPRPALRRQRWLNLNGPWEYAITSKQAERPDVVDGVIRVPFAVQSLLSGVRRQVRADQALWYRRRFRVPTAWRGQRVLLHFGAVDWQATVYLNDRFVGEHRGGYDPFTFDVTEALLPGAVEQTLVVRVWDPTDEDNASQARGKQVLNPGGIFYTAVTGIWQTVWLEPVGSSYIERLGVVTDVDTGTVQVRAFLRGDRPAGLSLRGQLHEGWFIKAKASGPADRPLTLVLRRPKCWSPQRPFLYDLTVELVAGGRRIDRVRSHVGLREISVEKDADGVPRLCLNHQPLFQFGWLDQGWWPDGLYTAPSDAALRYDLQVARALGANLLRKHVKVEPQRFYSWCDRMGLLVWQDMPSRLANRADLSPEQNRAADRQWEDELKRMVDSLQIHPSVVMWVIFNEGWGQVDTERITDWLKRYDPTRLVDSASGWTDVGVGDVRDVHAYPGPDMPPVEPNRALVLGEFGGLALEVPGHLWLDTDENWGYRALSSPEALKRHYVELITQLHDLRRRGLSAAVYTQLTDCEVEINGVMTYDRAVVKLDPAWARDLNRGYLPPRFGSRRRGFLRETTVTLETADPTATIRYSLDGSEPGRRSRRYEGAIRLDRDTVVRARCFWPDGRRSVTVEAAFRRWDTAIPSQPLEPEGPGLLCEVYHGTWGRLPDFESLTPVRRQIAGQMNLSDVPETERVALRFCGLLRIPRDGVYRLTVQSDDGSRLRIAGRLVVDHDGVHGMTAASGEIALEAGWHPIELLYFQGLGGHGLNVFYEGPGLSERIVPMGALGHRGSGAP